MPTGVYPMEKRKGLFQMGHTQLNSGRTWIKGGEKKRLGSKHTEESKKKMSLSKKGIVPKNIDILKKYWIGKKRKENCITPINKQIRKSFEYSIWRKSVFERDNYTCVFCGKRGGEIHPDHIKQFAYHPELRFEINNGRTLCRACHLKTETYGRKKHLCCAILKTS